jgi:hypothetical protein
MGRKDALFIGLSLLGLLGISASLLRRDRMEPPASVWPDRFTPMARAAQTTPISTSSKPAKAPSYFLSRPPQPGDWAATLEQLNQEFANHWRKQELKTAPPADDLAIARRLSLALTGTVPSLEEIRALERVRSEDRVEWWVSHLLEDRRFSDYVAERLARAYVGTENGPFLVYRRRRFVTWLSDHLARNTPYDELVRDLIADEGLWNGTPAVNFVTVTVQQDKKNQPDETRLAGRTARAFLAMRIDCLQCHDDKLGTILIGDEGKVRTGLQSDFHQLAAFFSQAELSLVGIHDGGDQYKFKYLNAEKEVVVPPQVPFAAAIRDGHGTRREQLARWVTHPENRAFARATVNRIWALMYGRPLVEPIDDIPLHGVYPPGLELLADDFVGHGYDLHRLIRLIAASAPFQRASQADFEITDAHEEHWAVFPLSRLRPEQVAGSLVQGASLSTIDADAHILSRLVKFGQTNDFVTRYGDIGEDEFAHRAGTIPQRLLMMNGNLVKERTDFNLVMNAASRIAVLTSDNDRAVEAAYLSLLTRRPTEEERAHFVSRLPQGGGERVKAIEDLYWVLINSTEFSWNH